MPLGTFLFESGWREPTGGDASWLLQLWFLAALWVYVMLFPAMALVAAWPPVRRGLDALGGRPTEIVVPVVAVALSAGDRRAARCGRECCSGRWSRARASTG